MGQGERDAMSTKRENIAVTIAAVSLAMTLAGGFMAWHAGFATRAEVEAGLGAVFLFLKSQNQNQRNHYVENVQNDETPPVIKQESGKQITRLHYEQQYIEGVQQRLGQPVPPE
jgi:hypothetical protein